MGIEIAGSWSSPGSPGSANEDGWGAAGFEGFQAVWIIDGCTDLDPEGSASIYPEGASSGLWHMGRLSEAFASAPCALAMEDPKAYVQSICEGVRERRLALGPLGPDWAAPSSAFFWVGLDKLGGRVRAIWLGDCCCVARQGEGGAFALGSPDDAAAAAAGALAGGALPPARTEQERLEAERASRKSHIRSGSRSLSVFPAPLSGLRWRDMRAPVDLLLSTDGFSRLWEMFGEFPAEQALGRAQAEGFGPMAARLRLLEAEHAAAVSSAVRKASDDATAIWAKIRPGA